MTFNPNFGSLVTSSDVLISNPANGQVLAYNSTASKWQNQPAGIPLATISMPGSLATGIVSLPFPIFGIWRFEAILVNVATAPSGASVIADVMYNGTTIYSTPANRPTITAGSQWAAGNTPNVNVFTGSASVRGYIQFSLLQVGSSGSEGADLVGVLYSTRVG
jgi:hypothetical protein